MNSLPTPPPNSSRWLPSETFSGRTALVTGGGTGLGLEIARGLAELGASVHIASRNAEHHQALRDEAAARGWQVAAHTLDVRDNHAVERLAAELPALDMLVNNAAGNFVCPAERLSANAWRAVLGI
ncbi:MAG: SDR family NAD(P)-dependent oxidoreductase, partial [Planctomycetia bacterium]